MSNQRFSKKFVFLYVNQAFDSFAIDIIVNGYVADL